MTHREASCSCGQLQAKVEGDPARISICHCLACQRRTGSVFGVQARFARDQVLVSGVSRTYTRTSDERDEQGTFHFCADCGATVYHTSSGNPDILAIPVGVFADPAFPSPSVSVWEDRKHDWVTLPADVHHIP